MVKTHHYIKKGDDFPVIDKIKQTEIGKCMVLLNPIRSRRFLPFKSPGGSLFRDPLKFQVAQ